MNIRYRKIILFAHLLCHFIYRITMVRKSKSRGKRKLQTCNGWFIAMSLRPYIQVVEIESSASGKNS